MEFVAPSCPDSRNDTLAVGLPKIRLFPLLLYGLIVPIGASAVLSSMIVKADMLKVH